MNKKKSDTHWKTVLNESCKRAEEANLRISQYFFDLHMNHKKTPRGGEKVNKKKAGLSFGWMVVILLAIVGVVWAAQTLSSYGTFDGKKNASLRIKESLYDTIANAVSGTTDSVDMHSYKEFAIIMYIDSVDADSSAVIFTAQVSDDASNWTDADTQTVRAKAPAAAVHYIEWTLPPALYYRVVYKAVMNAADSACIHDMYHVFQQ